MKSQEKNVLLVLFLLITFGLIQVYSSSYIFAVDKYGDGLIFFKKQLFFVVFGLGVMTAIRKAPQNWVLRWGWVVWAVDQKRTRANCCVGDVCRARLEAIVGVGFDRLGDCADAPDRAGVGGVVRIYEQGSVACVAGSCVRGEKGGLSARCDQDVVAGRCDVGAVADPLGHGVAQSIRAGNRRISSVSACRAGPHCVEDVLMRADVMFPALQLGALDAVADHAPRFVKDVPAVGAAACEACDACGEFHMGKG